MNSSQRLNPKAVLKELTRLDLVYGNRKSGDELGVLAKMFAGDCGQMSAEHFAEACRRHRRECSFFPTVHDLLKQYREILENLPAPNQGLLEMPSELSDEQIRINQEGIAKIRERLAAAKKMPAAYGGKGRKESGHNQGA